MKDSAFWGKMSDEYLKEHPEPPPLTDESLAEFEKRTGLKLPKVLTELLRVKNGGPLQNADFRFAGKDYQVKYIKAATLNESYDSIRPYSSILDDPDSKESRDALAGKLGDLSNVLLVAEPSGYGKGGATGSGALEEYRIEGRLFIRQIPTTGKSWQRFYEPSPTVVQDYVAG